MGTYIRKVAGTRIREIPSLDGNVHLQKFADIAAFDGPLSSEFEKQVENTTLAITTIDGSTRYDFNNSIGFIGIQNLTKVPADAINGYHVDFSADGTSWTNYYTITTNTGWFSSIKNDSNVHVSVIGRTNTKPLKLLVYYGDYV